MSQESLRLRLWGYVQKKCLRGGAIWGADSLLLYEPHLVRVFRNTKCMMLTVRPRTMVR